jgi:hypothetical protein
MQIPLDQLYPYVQSRFPEAVVFGFWPHGNRELAALGPVTPCTAQQVCQKPVIIAHDQEPLDFSAYELTNPATVSWLESRGIAADHAPDLNLSWACPGNAYPRRILLSGDDSGPDLDRYRAHPGFLPVHFWSHAVIARDWFRYAEADPDLGKKHRNIHHLFNVYCRAWSGSREYRLSLLSQLLDQGLASQARVRFSTYDQHCHYHDHEFQDQRWSQIRRDLAENFEINNSPPDSSGRYSAQDYRSTMFDVVLETVIDRVHVTEKTLRALACGQPFLVMAGAGTLAYLRRHGFRTYGDLIDESYDLCQDPRDRMTALMTTMHEITVKAKDANWLDEVDRIAEWNRRWFFGGVFGRSIIDRLCDDIDQCWPAVKTQPSTDVLVQIHRARNYYRGRQLDQHFRWIQDLSGSACDLPDHNPRLPAQS